jgi:23S rRNA (cytidine1920-2'-O)/16S rRNA (cytidine1409-2'-O)-methyltransferase
MAKKERADKLLVARGLAGTRTKAQALIMAGTVYSEEKRIDKAGALLDEGVPLRLKGKDHPYVSRGGLKLAHGLESFGISAADQICLDLGSSTGGFVDVLLRNNAKKVYAVDVGKGQLDWSLREHKQVTVLESTNARYLTDKQVPDLVDLITCDVSFIGLEKVLPAAIARGTKRAHLIALIKPQFQAGRKHVGKGGVVHDPEIHRAVCADVEKWIEQSMRWRVLGISESPITGPKGNREFLIGATPD